MQKSSPPKGPARPRSDAANFRQRYDDVERQRAELVARIGNMSESLRAHPGYKRVQTLLNDTFRKASIAQRGAVLQSAAWLIDLLESMMPFI